MCVDDRREERVAEQESANDDANKNENFGVSHHFHGGIIVGSDPSLELPRKGVMRWRTTRRSRWARWKDLGHHGCTGKGECMEE